MDTLFGLPAHSLLIHAPIVLLPIVAFATVVVAVKAAWRAVAGWFMVAAIFSVVVMLFLAKESGEAFDAAFAGAVDVSRHQDLAETTFILTLLWFVSFVALVGYEFAQRRRSAPTALSADVERSAALPAVSYALAGVTSVLALLAAVWLVRTGHEGAEVVWGGTTDQIFGG